MTAPDVPPDIGADWPERFPGAWQHWPEELKRYVRLRLIDWYLKEFGPAVLVKTIWAHTSDRILPTTGERLPFTAKAEDYWPLLVRDARAYYAHHPQPGADRAGSP